MKEFDDAYQENMRTKIEALKNSLDEKDWSEWESEFIESVSEQLQGSVISLTGEQEDKIFDLWERM